MAGYQISVTGRVQGVFYRATTQEMAQHLGLSGWVQNQNDGSVLIHAFGVEAQLDKLAKWCHSGPPMARVDSVAVESIEHSTAHNTFVIRR